MAETIVINVTENTETITFSYVANGEAVTITLNEAARGPAGTTTWAGITDKPDFGDAALLDASEGGNGATDYGKLAKYDGNGAVTCSLQTPNQIVRLGGVNVLSGTKNDNLWTIDADNISAPRNYQLPDKSGTVAMTSDITDGFTTNHVILNSSPTSVPTTEGTLSWNPDDHTINVQTDIADVIQQVGQEQMVRVKNVTGSTISNGKAVYLSGASGQRPTIALASASVDAHVNSTIGVATHDIGTAPGFGYVTTSGLVRGVNTQGMTEGSAIYLGESGAWSTTEPTNANKVRLGWVVIAGNNGTILVHVEKLSVRLTDTHAGASLTSKTTLVDADSLIIVNSEDANKTQRGTLTNFKTWLGTWIDALSTIAGAKTFSGQLQLTGQSATDANSAMTRGLADTRYGQEIKSFLTADGSAIQSQTVLQDTGCSVTLEPGTWHITTLILITNAISGSQAKFGGAITGGSSSELYGQVIYGTAAAQPVTDQRVAPFTTEQAYAASTSRAFLRHDFTLVVASGNPVVKTLFAQNVSQAGNTIPKAGSYIIATKV